MIAELGHLNEDSLVNRDPRFEIVEVESRDQLHDFKRVFVESYGIPEWAGQGWVDATAHIGIGRTPWRMFVGYLDGKPVATNMLFCGGGVASVYAVATVAEARGRGIGGLITGVPLRMAQEAGFTHGVLFSTEMGVSAYKRLGFELTSWRINRYLWRA
jgi:GNAT superfamily N-acetyltransferase